MSTKKALVNPLVIGNLEYDVRQQPYCYNYSPVHVTEHAGKMRLIPSISTSCRLNKRCLARMLNGDMICAECYANALLKQRGTLEKALERNTAVLTLEVLPLDLLPRFANVQIVRFESFGDLNNDVQLINYVNICRVNPSVTFALWTKNVDIVADVFGNGKARKPRNLIIIQSSRYKNVVDAPANQWIDKVFTVYTRDYIKAHGVEINCGSRNCATCRKCYNKRNGVKNLSEIKK